MPKMIVRHEVKDFSKWNLAFKASEPIRKMNGEKSYEIYRNTENLNDISIVFDWESVERAVHFSQSAELQETMKKAGVLGEPKVYLSEAALES